MTEKRRGKVYVPSTSHAWPSCNNGEVEDIGAYSRGETLASRNHSARGQVRQGLATTMAQVADVEARGLTAKIRTEVANGARQYEICCCDPCDMLGYEIDPAPKQGCCPGRDQFHRGGTVRKRAVAKTRI